MLESLAYQGNYQSFTLTLAGVDISDDMSVIRDLNASADFPVVGSFRIVECTIELNDPDGYYVPENDNNFFVVNDLPQAGIGVAVGFAGGFADTEESLFSGTIFRITHDAPRAITTITCAGQSRNIGLDEVDDFGIERRFRISEEQESVTQRALGEGEHRANIRYPVLPAVLPASNGSASVYESIDSQLNPVDQLRTEGDLDYRNFVVTEDAVETEGSRIPLDSAELVTFPQLRMKSPYRHRKLKNIVDEILTQYGITNSDVELFEPTLPEHFSSNGRIGYNIIGQGGFDISTSWEGYPTDRIADGNDFYTLYTIARGDPSNRSKVIKYNFETDIEEIVHTFVPNREVWNLAKDGDVLYVLYADYDQTNQRVEYDSLAPNSSVAIMSINLDTNAVAVVANAGSPQRPTLAAYYNFGNNKTEMLPDNRRGFQVYNGSLYYCYTAGTDEIGIMQLGGSVVMSARHDRQQNQAGLSFDINDSGLLVGGVTWRTGANSTEKMFKKQL